MTEIDPSSIEPELRGGWLLRHVRGGFTRDTSAVRILLATDRWITDDGFAGACLGAEQDEDDAVRMWIDWEAAVSYIDDHAEASDSELALGRLAAAIALREPVVLTDVLGAFDSWTARTVMAALASLAGSNALDDHIGLWEPGKPRPSRGSYWLGTEPDHQLP